MAAKLKASLPKDESGNGIDYALAQEMTGNEQLVATHFPKDVADHVLTIRHDEGLYRHLSFATPGTGIAHFNITTWPGYLATSGDMGSFTFCRLEDMFEFFRGQKVNVGYWSEKLVALDRNCARNGRRYSQEAALDWLKERVDEWVDECDQDNDALIEELEDAREELIEVAYSEELFRNALRDFRVGPHEFNDVWEESWDEPDYHLLWALHAIRWGIQQYDAAQADQ